MWGRDRTRGRYANLSLIIYFLAFLPSLQLVLRTHAFAERQDALNPINWVERGSFAEKRHDLVEALADYTEAIKKTSTDPIPLYDRARVYSMLHENEDALKDAEASVQISPVFADGFALIARLQRDAGHLDDSLTAINRAISLRPSELRYKSLRGDVLEREGLHDKASSDYETVIRADMNNIDALYAEARIKLLQNKQNEALTLLQRYAGIANIPNITAVRVVTQLLISENRPNEALEWISTHGSNDERLVEYHAQALAMLGRFSEAESLLRLAPEKGSDFGETIKGQVAMATGNCEQAVRAFKRATLGSYRDASDIWRNYGIANICTRKVGAAIAAFDEAIRLDHADALAYRYRADAYRSLGLLDDAIRDAKEALRLAGPDARLLMMLGVDEYRSRDRRLGRADYQRGCSLLQANELAQIDLCKKQLPHMQN